jgi:bacteriocin biosynthesis cyclodehydratase domain-containing protein
LKIENMRLELPNLPVLSRNYHVIPLDRDLLQICDTSQRFFMRSTRLEDLMGLLHRLDGESSAQSLSLRFGRDWVETVLRELLRLGLLQDGRNPGDRAVNKFTHTEFSIDDSATPQVGPDGHTFTVTVVGCGVIGRAVALLLTQAKIGLQLADPDSDTMAELVPRPLFAQSLGHDLRVDVRSPVRQPTEPLTWTVVDLPLQPEALSRTKLAVIERSFERTGGLADAPEQCLSEGIPYLLYSVDGPEACVGPLISVGGRPCHACVESRRQSHLKYLAEYQSYLHHRASCAPRLAIYNAREAKQVASFVAQHAIRLLGAGLVPEEIAWTINLKTDEVVAETVLPVPGCVTCMRAETSGRE